MVALRLAPFDGLRVKKKVRTNARESVRIAGVGFDRLSLTKCSQYYWQAVGQVDGML